MVKKLPTNKHKKQTVNRIVEYLVTGGAWFWSGYLLFALVYGVFKWNIIPAKALSYIFGLTINFILERFWVFDDTKSKKVESVTGRYIVLSAINLVIDVTIVWGLNQIGITPYIGQFISAGFFTVWNYVWYKLWVFAKQQSPGPKRPAAPHLHRPKHVRYQMKRVTR